jgi:hypothetical protein
MSHHYGNLRAVLLKHLLGLEPEATDHQAGEWERMRAEAVAEFLPEVENTRLTQRTLAELDQRSSVTSEF